MGLKAPINKIIPFSAVDGPGNRTAVFVQGCTYACKYCHNPETIRMCVHCGACVEKCPTGAIALAEGKVRYDVSRCVLCDTCIRTCAHMSSPRIQDLSASEVMEKVRRNVPFVRGVTVSGGECTMYRDFLLELAKLAHGEGLSVLLDSNGGYDFSADRALTDAVDGVMLDVKAWSKQAHVRLTGCSNETVIENLRFLAASGKLAEVRTVMVPDWMDAEETVRGVCETLTALDARQVVYKLIKFRPIGVRAPYDLIQSPSDQEMRRLEQIAHEYGITHTILI